MSEQLCLLPEGLHESRSALHGPQVASRPMLQIAEVGGAVVRHGEMLQIPPDALHRVQLRRVGRQVLECDGATLDLDVLADELGAMRLQTVPDRSAACDRSSPAGPQQDTAPARCAGVRPASERAAAG